MKYFLQIIAFYGASRFTPKSQQLTLSADLKEKESPLPFTEAIASAMHACAWHIGVFSVGLPTSIASSLFHIHAYIRIALTYIEGSRAGIFLSVYHKENMESTSDQFVNSIVFVSPFNQLF